MKLPLIILTLAGYVASMAADGTSKDHSAIGPKFTVIWQASTNEWPEKLWVYKAIPQEFAPAVITNLLTLSGFTQRDKTRVPTFIKEKDNRASFYGELEGTVKHLAVYPTLGHIDYVNPRAEASSQLQRIEGVPNESESTRLGLRYLRLLGIDVSQIARKPGTTELDLHWQKGTIIYTDQKQGKEVIVTNRYGVMFSRQIDGVKVHGYGGLDISFGNNAQVVSLQLSWRNLQHYQLKDCMSFQSISELIQTGSVALHPLGSKAIYSIEQLRKLTVKSATPLYEGKTQDEPMQFVRPYGSFQGVADNGTNVANVWFECAILK